MPKELIYSDTPPFWQDADGNETPAVPGGQDGPLPGPLYRRAVHVGWSREKYVEVGVALVVPSTEEAPTGHFTSLDRAGLNQLIRALRKARDAAYGRDE